MTPPAARALLAQLTDWSVHQHASTGTVEFNGLSEETDGEGKRKRVTSEVPVDSFLVRAAHVDGRAFVAVWLARRDRPTKSGKPSWSLDTCWRGRRFDELAPKPITAKELKVYVALKDVA